MRRDSACSARASERHATGIALGRHARVALDVLTALILLCAAAIVATCLFTLARRPAGGGSDVLGTEILLTLLFGLLDLLVFARLARPILLRVRGQTGVPPRGRVLLAVLSLPALMAAIILFFGFTCYGLLQALER